MTTQYCAKKGFTLIEILVVVSIIGLLSAVVLGSLGTARVKGRDAARIVEIREIKKALEFYYDDNKKYPQPGGQASNFDIAADPFKSYLVPQYIGDIPLSLGVVSGDQDLYRYSGTNAYVLLVYREKEATWCRTGVNIPAGIWATFSLCNF